MRISAVFFLVILSVSSYAASSSFKVFLSPSSTSQISLGDLDHEVSLVVVYDHEGCFVMSSAVNKSNPILEVLSLPSGSYQMVGLDVFEEVIQEGKLVIN